jgi:hypothetical protein
MQNQSQTPETPNSGAKLSAFLTGAVLAASALVGGLAVVLWNRRILAGLRQQSDPAKAASAEPDVNDE